MTVRVSDHALVRWLERVGGIDMDYFRDHIASVVQDAAEAGATKITIDGFIYAVTHNGTKDHVLTTVLEADMRPKKDKVRNLQSACDRKYGDRDWSEIGFDEEPA